MSNSDIFVSAAYLLYVIAPGIRDELWLRTALFVNSVGFAAWGIWIDSLPVVVANVLFCLMSLRQMHRAWDERRPVRLTSDASAIGTSIFPDMSARELQMLWQIGTSMPDGDARLTTIGEAVSDLFVVIEGTVHVTLADGTVVTRSAPAVVGEVTALSTSIDGATATVDVRDARTRRWAKSDIAALQLARPSMAAPFVQGLSAQLAERLVPAGVSAETSVV